MSESPRVTINGLTCTRAEWRKLLGLSEHVYAYRIKAGWTIEQALTTPARKDINYAYRNKPTKICLGCEQELEKNETNFSKKGAGNWRSHCRNCVTAARRLDHRRTRRNWTPVQRRTHGLFVGAKRRAVEFSLPFTITREWVRARLEKGVCEATGIPFSGPSTNRAFIPSLDRKDPALGYTPANTQVVVFIHNCARNNWGDAALHSYIKQYLKFLLAKKSRKL